MTEIHLPPLAAPVDALWHAVLDLSERLTVPWTLVGGQMVLLHALEHGQVPPQVSQDADIVADVRTSPRALREVVAVLTDLDFDVAGMSPAGVAHRYERPATPRSLIVDVLAPEGLGERVVLTTTPPGRTIQTPGGTQALERTEFVLVVHEGRRVRVPRPSLLASMISKAAACEVDPHPARHHRDLAFLCCLVDDPFAIAATMTPKDKSRLRSAKVLSDSAHPAWGLTPADLRDTGHVTFTLLMDT